MDKILQSPDSVSIEPMLCHSILIKFEKRINMKIRFVRWLKADINFQARQKHSQKEQRNLSEALHAIYKIELAKSK